jgi:hypothetical protein
MHKICSKIQLEWKHTGIQVEMQMEKLWSNQFKKQVLMLVWIKKKFLLERFKKWMKLILSAMEWLVELWMIEETQKITVAQILLLLKYPNFWKSKS